MKNASVSSVKLIRAIVPDSVRAWQRRSPAPARVRNESFYETALQLSRGKYRADFRIHSPELLKLLFNTPRHKEFNRKVAQITTSKAQ
ncbi:MAG TPA: hypothetical protein VNZ64_09730 [Candidatus Acidoferrum sp.]|nr:hypothetical protein [Candidatus Acidoferrum sp.]